MKTYLVTGGAGFIGSNFIHYLMESRDKDNIMVINLDALTYSGKRNNTLCFEAFDNYRFIEGNICDELLLKEIFEEYDIDCVVHFAAETHVDRSLESADVFVETNVRGTLSLLKAAKESWLDKRPDTANTVPANSGLRSSIGFRTDCITGADKESLADEVLETTKIKVTENISKKRFLYISTDEIYGQLTSNGYFTENSPIRPRNPYSASKAAGEMLAYSYYSCYGLPVLITRSSNNYGPFQHHEKFIPHCIKACLTDKAIPLYGDGLNIRDWLYVKDNCSAIYTILQAGKAGEVYNIGCHNEQRNIDLARMIIEILASDFGICDVAIKYIKDRKGHDRRYAVDPSKIKNELGWNPETDFMEGLRKTIHWYMENKEYLSD